ncbi:polysaccharide pyruvyl transferase family protein [Isoptericola sp. NPDC056605]|uniref:polysaccharide pyruvyl transferase family protein n=1 Tax=Isoptericola sp. NPDC056605 TaxID=3345876 RepID=UPI00367FF0BC
MTAQALLLGIARTVPDAPFMDAAQLNAAVGNNTGNLAFVQAIDQQLGGGLPRYRRLERAEIINARPEPVAVVPCANHLGTHLDLAGEAAHFAKIEKPMIAIGLGAQANVSMNDLPDLPEGSARWLRELAERSPNGAPNISVRGEFTRRVLEKYGVDDKAVVLGCPTLFLGPAQIGKTIAEAAERPIRRVAVASGHYRWRHLHRLERSLARIVEETHGAYVLQSPLEMLRAYREEWEALPADVTDDMSLSLFDDGNDLDRLRSWYRAYSIALFDVPAWMNYLRSFDFVIGPRIHGVMLALQAGVPGLCIAHDSRTAELCQTMGVPHVRASEVRNGIALQDIRRLFQFDPAAFDARRQQLGEDYVAFLSGNGLRADLL